MESNNTTSRKPKPAMFTIWFGALLALEFIVQFIISLFGGGGWAWKEFANLPKSVLPFQLAHNIETAKTQVWRFLYSQITHKSTSHFCGNFRFILLATYTLEVIIGITWKELALVTLYCGAMVGIVLVHLEKSVIGASGIVFAYKTMMGALFVINFGSLKKNLVMHFLLIDAAYWVFKEAALLGKDDGISHEAHIIGAVLGFLSTFALKLGNDEESEKWNNVRKVYRAILVCSYLCPLIALYCRT